MAMNFNFFYLKREQKNSNFNNMQLSRLILTINLINLSIKIKILKYVFVSTHFYKSFIIYYKISGLYYIIY